MSNQILWDCHMHSSFSADSDTSMEDMIHEAIRRNLSGIWFTEHLHPDYPPTPASRPETKSEARGRRLGHGVWDVVFVKK